MPTNTKVKGLKINTLTKAQFDTAVQGGIIGANELSIITDLDESIQVDSLPVASASNLGVIYQYIGSTTSTYTQGYFYQCISTGTSPNITYSWTRIDVQPAGGGSSLPPQAGNSGKFLTTDGTDASWANIPNEIPTQSGNSGKFLTTNGTSVSWAPALINNLSSSSIVNTIYVSDNYRAYHSYSTAVGNSADTGNTYATSIGYNTNSGNYSVAIGANAKANVTGAVQIGKGTNSTAGTMYVALGTTSSSITNYQLLASDGTIPEARLASTTSATQNQVLKLDSNLNAVWADDNGATVTIRDWTV